MSRLFFLSFLIFSVSCADTSKKPIVDIQSNATLVIIGNNLGSRMMDFGHFETELYLRYPDSSLVIRNMADPGNTPGFRPHPSRDTPWAFEEAELYQTLLAEKSHSEGHFAYPDEWLSKLKADVILGFFGFNEAFEGNPDLVRSEMLAFIEHTRKQTYNNRSTPQLVLITPTAYEKVNHATLDVPDGKKENEKLSEYVKLMQSVADSLKVPMINVFEKSKEWFSTDEDLTLDGFQLNDQGYQVLGEYLASTLFGPLAPTENRELVHKAVMEKNWVWHNYFKIPNGVHVHGRRYEPFGPDNYPAELTKLEQMVAIRDTAIWDALKGERKDVWEADKHTLQLPAVETNYTVREGKEPPKYLYGEEALESFVLPEGYKLELFASEKEFPDLANPVQMSFDNKGRLWVAVMPTYPHYKPGDSRPNDKLLILEDTDGDGKADKQTVFADSLHLPIGFEIAPEGVYISQAPHLKLLVDRDNDDQADDEVILLSGFDDHDTHHAISAFSADPSGAIYMGEGVFLHTNVETPYGPVRGTNGGFYRYNPARQHLERTAQVPIPNPWGIAFDEWGQNFYAETSGPVVSWMMPASIKPKYGRSSPKSRDLIEPDHRVRPTSGLEFLSSRHFPDEVQGDLLINNTIGFLGMKQHKVMESGTGFETVHRQDIIRSSDPNFRPVDMEIAPDGSLYFIDWHNVLIGHMQHNARDPLRDHVHGRVYRITYPNRPLIEPASIDGEPIRVLLDNLKLPEYRSRYRSRRELRGRNPEEVMEEVKAWVANLDENDARFEHHLLEGAWVIWGLNRLDLGILGKLFSAEDHRVRAAAIRIVRYSSHLLDDQASWLEKGAQDAHGRVRLEALVAASWLDPETGMKILDVVSRRPLDDWMMEHYRAAEAHLNNQNYEPPRRIDLEQKFDDKLMSVYLKGKEIYSREGYCITCHQVDGRGLTASGFPPLAGTDWVLGNKERLIKLTLQGLMGPLEINGIKYDGQVPMTPFKGLLSDEEAAAVLTYVRNSFGNEASPVTASEVAAMRKQLEDKVGFYTPEELLNEETENE